MWMTNTVPTSQTSEDGNFLSHIALPGSASDDTCVTALEERIMSGADNWMGFSSSSTTIAEGSLPQSGMTASVTNDDVNRQSSITWHVPQNTHCQSGVDRSIPPQRTEHKIQRVSANNIQPVLTVGVNSSTLVQSESRGPQNRTLQPELGLSSVAVDRNAPPHVLSEGQSAPKRRSSEHCPVSHRASDATVTVQMPKQRAHSLHTLTPNASYVPQNVVSGLQDRAGGGGGGDSFPFVAPRQRVQHQHTVAAVLQQSSQPVSERKTSVEATCDEHAEKLTEPAAIKHVTFTDQKVRAK